jgi:hypothetical protein
MTMPKLFYHPVRVNVIDTMPRPPEIYLAWLTPVSLEYGNLVHSYGGERDIPVRYYLMYYGVFSTVLYGT